MTDQLILTTAQRDHAYKALENSIDGVTQQITDHKAMWCDTPIPSRLAQRQRLELLERDHKDAIEMLQSLPVVQGEPVAYRQKRLLGKNKHWHYDAHEINPDYLHEFEPLYTSPQPLQPITADDVTDDMVRVMSYFHGYTPTDKEVIAAAYNAVIKNRSEAR